VRDGKWLRNSGCGGHRCRENVAPIGPGSRSNVLKNRARKLAGREPREPATAGKRLGLLFAAQPPGRGM